MFISNAVDASAIARVLGIKTEFKDLRGGGIVYLPQRIALIGQGSEAATYPLDKMQFTKALDVAQTYGFGSPLHLCAMQLFPLNGDGIGTIPLTVYPLDPATGAAAAAGVVAATGTATRGAAWYVIVNNMRSEAIVSAKGDSADDIAAKVAPAIAAVLELPVTALYDSAGNTDIIAKWQGENGNDIKIEVEGPTDAGVTWVLTDMTGGLLTPDIDKALNQIGDVWETMVLNTFSAFDTDTLDKIQTYGEGRWGALTRKPFVAFTGCVAATVTDAMVASNDRGADRVNALLMSPGSLDLPFVVAARQLARIVVVANNTPPSDYGSQDATGLHAGPDSTQWLYLDRDRAVKNGCSTVTIKDTVVNISDTITFYRPTGDALPAYRYVVDIVKLQNIIFNLDIIFATKDWDGAPLLPDDQPTTNRQAKKPKTAKAAVASMVDRLGLHAFISDPARAKESIQAAIDFQNPKRLNVGVTVKLCGNTNISSVDLNFGYFFGTLN